MISTAQPRRHFLPWDRPWLPQVAAWLARDWEGRGPLDLSDVMAIVPTRQSGRRLREALAEHALARGSAVFAPRVHTPDTLLAKGAEAPDVASRLEAWLAWIEVLRTIDLAEVAEVLPVAPPQRDFAWAARLAESFVRLQTQLAENGLAIGDVAGRVGADFPETERWRQLGRLERAQLEQLAARGRREPHAARREFARAPALPDKIARIVVLAAPDPLPLALEVLGRWAEKLPVDVVVHAPPREAAAFDTWGRPLPGVWAKRVIALSEFEQRVHLCADPAAEARKAAAIASGHGTEADGLVALGVADAEVLPVLERELSRTAVAGYNPEGRARRGERLHGLLSALGALARAPTFDAVAALARCPDFLAMLAARFGAGASAARFLKELDDTRANHLPADLAALRRVARGEVARVVPLIEELRALLVDQPFPENAATALALIFAERRLDLATEEGARAIDAAEAWRAAMHECAQARALFPDVPPAEWWELALRIFGDGRRTEEKPPGALDLQGWLELLWEDAPHLVVAGCNDGVVPEAVVGDAFLPETLRERLGLKTNAARFARDAYVLEAIASARRGAGTQLDLLYAKASSIGEPLRPSRLLLRCEDAALPARVAFLFRPVEATRGNLPWTRAWRLTPRHEPPPKSVAVTGVRAWLACPFRFYLSHVLRLEPVEPAKNELDARDFGTLCHGALEAMALAPGLREADEGTLREFLLTRFDAVARERFGENLTLPLVVQCESARQRLARAAAIHVRDREEGWTTEHAEWKFSLDLGGLEVRGKIDRIDRHATGARRVLDYKTADTATAPQRAHLRPLRPGDEQRPEWMRVTLGNRDYVWADLQLPLYVRALEAEAGGSAVVTGYFNLPKAVGETAIALWPELHGKLLDAARACADGAAAAIRAGEFWPPSENASSWDAFAALFHHGAAESVAWREGAEAVAR